MRRREFIACLGSVVTLPVIARAQQQRVPVVGVLWHAASQKEEVPFFDWLREGFTKLGYVPGKNIKFEDRYPAEIPERFESMAAELVQMKVDVMIGVGGPCQSPCSNKSNESNSNCPPQQRSGWIWLCKVTCAPGRWERYRRLAHDFRSRREEPANLQGGASKSFTAGTDLQPL
jgi:hypothetical protein